MDSYNNKRILINGKTVYAQSVSLSTVSELAVNFVNQDVSNEYSPINFVKNTLSLNYFLEADDQLLPYIFDHKRYITGDFCGINFTSGLLQAYSVNISPNNPIEASATINFWGGTGILSQNNSWYNNQTTLPASFTGNLKDPNIAYALNGSGVYFVHKAGLDVTNQRIKELAYSFTSTPNPIFRAGYSEPIDFNFKERNADISVTIDSPTGLLNVSGSNTYFDVNLRTISGNTVFTLPIQGYIYQRNYAANAGGLFDNKFSIVQSNIIKPFTANSLSAASAYIGETLTINGTNLDKVTSVKIGGSLLQSFSKTPTTLSFTIPKGAKTSSIILNNDAQTSGNLAFTVLDSGIIINEVSPISGSFYEYPSEITISGQGFYDISYVGFGSGITNNFSVVSDNIIKAYVSSGASYGFVSLQSIDRGLTSYSPHRFVPIPNVLGYVSDYDFFGATIVLTGDNMSGITGVSFNNLAAIAPSSNTLSTVSLMVPSGNTRGYMRFYSPSGITKLSSFQFDPEIFITGVNKWSAPTGAVITITGERLVPQLMSSLGGDYYAVEIGDSGPSYFGQTSYRTLTGIVPTGATTGPVSILANNGGKYSWSGIFTVTPPAQEVYSFIPSTVYYPNEVRVSGKNFFNVVSVEYSNGYTGPGTGVVSGYKVSADGKFISIPTTGIGDYIIGANTDHLYDVRIVTQQADTSYSSAFTLSDIRISGEAVNHNFELVNLYSGVDTPQTDSLEFGNWSSYVCELTMPRLSGFSWYGATSGFTYGVGRTLSLNPGSTGTLNVYTSGSGNIYTRDLTGVFRSADGYTQNFIIELRPL
jgi:hypothetical protein